MTSKELPRLRAIPSLGAGKLEWAGRGALRGGKGKHRGRIKHLARTTHPFETCETADCSHHSVAEPRPRRTSQVGTALPHLRMQSDDYNSFHRCG
eukprot:2619889-Alexandrium_andersonii.AAC.1